MLPALHFILTLLLGIIIGNWIGKPNRREQKIIDDYNRRQEQDEEQ